MEVAAGRWIDVVVGSLWFRFASEVGSVFISRKVGGGKGWWGFQEIREGMK